MLNFSDKKPVQRMHGLQQLSFDRICAEIILREVISSKFTLEGFPKDFFGQKSDIHKKTVIRNRL